MDFANVAVVFPSCDEYKVIWDSFAQLYCQHAPFLPKTLFGTVKENYYSNGLTFIGNNYHGKDQSYCTRLIETIKRLPVDIVLIIMDDYLFVDDVDEAFVREAFDIICSDDSVGQICLHDYFPHVRRCSKRYNCRFWIMDQRASYRCNLQIGFWKKNYLLQCLRRGESPWQFEYFGTYRAIHYKTVSLYRDDADHRSIPVLRSGAYVSGRINQNYLGFFRDQGIVLPDVIGPQKTKDDKGKSPIVSLLCGVRTLFFRGISFLYPMLSVRTKWVRQITGYVPKYVRRYSTIPDDIALP